MQIWNQSAMVGTMAMFQTNSAQGESARLETYIASLSDSPCTSSSGPSRKRRRKGSLTTFNEEWKKEYLMYPAGSGQAVSSMVCIVCGAVLASLKLSTIKRHIQRRHKDSLSFAESRKSFLIQKR